jgi:hypothetical protein
MWNPECAISTISFVFLLLGCGGERFVPHGPDKVSDFTFVSKNDFKWVGDSTTLVTPPLRLGGQPDFARGNLNSEQRLWYDRFWAAVVRDRQGDRPDFDATSGAGSDNLYTYARPINQHMNALLTAFRATGDLKILDEVDRLAQIMRAQLFDGDCDGSNKDGFLNWRYRRHPDSVHWCRDIHEMDEMLTHAGVAQFAYAFHANRALTSPGGVDYAERADFWRNYLENHFEAKWRKRSGRAWPRMDFLTRTLFHPNIQFIRYHYYMWKITGKDEYRAYAQSQTDKLMDTVRSQNKQTGGLLRVPTPLGTAIVWSHRAPDPGWSSVSEHGQSFVYSRYSIIPMADLHMEGFYRWDQSIMQGVGTALAYYVMDTDDLSGSGPFAQGINGDVTISQGGWTLVPNSSRRETISRFVQSSHTLVMPFMHDGAARDRVRRITLEAYSLRESDVNRPRNVIIPAIMVQAATLKSVDVFE